MSAFPQSPAAATPATPAAVTVLGLGPMGRALAGAFVAAGVRTTVWNRTPGRDRELIERGAHGAASAAEAVAASPLTVVSVVDYDASDAVLRTPEVTAALRGRTLVNLTADTPERARDTGSWAAGHGIAYLDGAIMTPTPTIGTPDAVVILSGPADLAAAHGPVLDALGGARTHLGEDIGRAAAYDIALLDIFWTSMTGYMHALAVAGAEGIKPGELAPFAQGIAVIMPPLFEGFAADIEDGGFSGEINPLTSALSSLTHIVRASENHGIDASLARAAEGLARRTVALGHGADGYSRIAEFLGRR
ncbi:NAD(P)-dependent oxidoreductase [Streptomyces sp. NPDC090025]|uniref:NAD(P)-dependent oxidoreductase n=1 Tax=Streptomyces sp. NPDC090025 TaxID=3365922 RepID=UPI003837E16E